MSRPSQLDLIDRTPMGLWGTGRSVEPQDEPEAQEADYAKGAPAQRPACLCCGRKPARAGSCCCSEKCKSKLSGSLNAWAAKLKPVEEGVQNLLTRWEDLKPQYSRVSDWGNPEAMLSHNNQAQREAARKLSVALGEIFDSRLDPAASAAIAARQAAIDEWNEKSRDENQDEDDVGY